MNPGGPQQFDLTVSEPSFQTNNPHDPVVGLDILAVVTVTIRWNDAGTALDPAGVDTKDPDQNGVVYDVVWASPGPGPFDLFEERLGGGQQKIGTVVWSVTTKTLVAKKHDPATGKTRLGVFPMVQLVRTIARTDAAPQVDVVNTASPDAPQQGNGV